MSDRKRRTDDSAGSSAKQAKRQRTGDKRDDVGDDVVELSDVHRVFYDTMDPLVSPATSPDRTELWTEPVDEVSASCLALHSINRKLWNWTSIATYLRSCMPL